MCFKWLNRELLWLHYVLYKKPLIAEWLVLAELGECLSDEMYCHDLKASWVEVIFNSHVFHAKTYYSNSNSNTF